MALEQSLHPQPNTMAEHTVGYSLAQPSLMRYVGYSLAQPSLTRYVGLLHQTKQNEGK